MNIVKYNNTDGQGGLCQQMPVQKDRQRERERGREGAYAG